MYSLRRRNGFTLVELLVAISVVAILSTIGFTVFQDARTKAIQAKTKADLDAIRKAYEQNFDPSANGGQGGYKQLSPTGGGSSPYFSDGKIPTPQGGGSYIISGPDVDSTNTSTYVVSADKNTGQACQVCGGNCSCVTSTGGTPASTSSGSSGGSCAVAGSPLGNILNNGLVGYWKMDSTMACGSNTCVPDSSGNGYDGTLAGGLDASSIITPTPAYPNSDSSFSKSVNVTASDLNRISLPILSKINITPGGYNTVTLWMKVSGMAGYRVLVNLSSSGTQSYYYLGLNSAMIGFGDGGGQILGTALSGIPSGWVHVAAIFYNGLPTSTNNSLYINGVLQTLTSSGIPLASRIVTTTGSQINGISTGAGFLGYIDDVRIYNRALSPEDIVKVKDNPAAPCQ